MKKRFNGVLWAAVTIAAIGCKEETKKVYVCEAGYHVNDAGTLCFPDPPSCDPNSPVSIADDCTSANRHCLADPKGASCGPCLTGFREELGACIQLVTCDALKCEDQNMSCREKGEHEDAVCFSCEEGSFELEGECVFHNCGDEPGSLVASCEEQHKTCVEDAVNGTTCGECLPGYRKNNDICEVITTCEDLNCPQYQRSCEKATNSEDAKCVCTVGQELINESCRPKPGSNCHDGTEDDISQACETAQRICQVDLTAGVAYCGTCLDGYIEDAVNGLCLPETTCDALNCAAENRECIDEPTGHCTSCLPGYMETADEVTGEIFCRPVKTCTDLTCGEGEVCVPSTENRDAYCRPDCQEGTIWSGTRCTPCPTCDDETMGEKGIWPWPTAAGECICETMDGYFQSIGADMGVVKCDSDDDGWIKESARMAILSSDPNIKANARCHQRVIESFKLVNEQGEFIVQEPDSPVPMYETDKNDDDDLLHAIWREQKHPDYGITRKLTAAELNPLTKMCHFANGDYNDNGVPDVAEYGNMPIATLTRTDQNTLNRFSYFKELYNGRFVASVDEGYGQYVIREKSRQANPTQLANSVPMAFLPEDGEYWRECTLQRDAEWNVADPAPIGMDFAEFHDSDDPNETWSGMNLHSLFKCILIDSETTAGRYQLTTSGFSTSGLRANRCTLSGNAISEGDKNPRYTEFDCIWAGATTLDIGDVIWGGVTLLDYATEEDYLRGCVNECIEQIKSIDECFSPTTDYTPTGCALYELADDNYLQCDSAPVKCFFKANDFGRFDRCEAWELCDNVDNDYNGHTDEGDPDVSETNPIVCNTNERGICAAGALHCCSESLSQIIDSAWASVCTEEKYGTMVCIPDEAPQDDNNCNNQDDDCDGKTDEDFHLTEEEATCTIETTIGACRNGEKKCEAGHINCISTHTREANDSCDNETDEKKDDDCDGQTDEDILDPLGSGQCPETFTKFYRDHDKDGYPNLSDFKCQCAPRGEYTIEELPDSEDDSNRPSDCCDSDPIAKPYSNPADIPWKEIEMAPPCSGYDYNCDGKEERELLSFSHDDGCAPFLCIFGTCFCEPTANGWKGETPACGKDGIWYERCSNNEETSECIQETSIKFQRCR